MATFEFTSEGIEVGFDRRGFYAHGRTTKFGFDEREYPGHGLPNIQTDEFYWSINTLGEDVWKNYAEVISAWSHDPADWPMTSREAVIKSTFHERLVSLFVRWNPGEVTLNVSFPPSADFATMIMGALAAGRQIDFYSNGFNYADESRPDAAAPTVSGWSERKEPLFTTHHPIIRVV